MAYQKLQVSRAIDVIPSDTIDIPNPSLDDVASGTITTTAPSPNDLDRLTDSSGNFQTKRVSVGDVVYVLHASTTNQITTVASVDSETQLTLSDDVSFISGDSYRIFHAGQNNGCILYIGNITAGSVLRVLTAGGDDITLKGVVSGSYTPVQVLRVFSDTTVSNIVALW
tara:strand:+ start:47 stop:553 length:507 start_codon:yes stop_codon:yes gene_type:complete